MNPRHLKLAVSIILVFVTIQAVLAQEKPPSLELGLVSAALPSLSRTTPAGTPGQQTSLEDAGSRVVTLDSLIA